MKLFSLRLTTLKSKLYAIVFTSFIVRVVAFFLLPTKTSDFAPDEGTYAYLSEWIEAGKPANKYWVYGNLYQTARALILPAAGLVRVGVDPIHSVRMISNIYGMLSLVVIAWVLLSIQQTRQFLEINSRMFQEVN